jgi:hypothetical protein
MVWLYSRPMGVLVVGCLAIAAVVAIVARLAVRALVPDDEREAAAAVAAPLMPALGAAFAILAALTLANEANSLSAAQAIVSTEAAAASRLAWAATTPGIDTVPIHDSLRAYLDATRTSEWHGDAAADGTDADTATALASLERTVREDAAQSGVGTPTSTELLASLDALTTGRRDRLAAASRQLPGLYVITLAVAGIALIANAGVLTIRVRRRTALIVGGLATVIGLSMALLFAIGAPWRGPVGVSTRPIDAIVSDLDSGYFHP